MSVRPEPNQTSLRPPVAASRALAGLEHAMRLTDEVTPFNVVCALQLHGDVPVANLRAALDTLQRRHPLLRARITPKGKGFLFDFDVTAPIPLEVTESPLAGGWIASAQDELHRPLGVSTGPLMRCRYLAGPSGGDLIVTIHHTIVDAASAPHLFGELLSLCAGVEAPLPDEAAQEGQLPASALFPDEHRGWRAVLATLRYLGRQMADEVRFRWHSRGVRTPPIAASGHCRILPVRFPADVTARVVEASRRERVTLNAIFSAALMAAVQRRLYPSPAAPLRHLIFADLRPRLRTRVPDGVLGCFLTMFRFTVMVRREGAFWDLARDIQESTLRAARFGERYLSYALSPGMMKAILGLKAFRMAATALSYSGPTGLRVDYGAFEITGLHAFAANFTLGPEYSALVRLFRGELWWDILYLDSDMDEAEAQAIAAEVLATLERATC